MSDIVKEIKKRNVDKVRQLVANNSSCIEKWSGTNLLSLASQKSCLEIVKILIEYGANVNDEYRIMYPDEAPIAQAALIGNFEITKLLLDSGAEVNIPSDDPEYWTPLMCAVSGGNIKIVQLLVEAGADVNEIRDGGNFALCIAARSSFQDIFDYLAPLSHKSLRQVAEEELRKEQ